MQGDVTIDSCIYQINRTKMRRVAVTSIPLQTQVCCNAFSPDHEKLMLGCIDGSMILFDEGRGITHLVKAAFVRFIYFLFLKLYFDGVTCFCRFQRSCRGTATRRW